MTRSEQPEWLESFIAVADLHSFSAAAEAVYRSQSRVSAHVAALERSLGAPLFDRRHRPVRLTDAGEAYLPHARMVLAALHGGADAIGALTGRTSGVVVVGAPPSVSAGFLVGVVARLAQSHPEIRVELTEGTTARLTSQLLAGQIDLALRPEWPSQPESELTSEALWHEPFVVVTPQGHRLTEGEGPVDPAALDDEVLISIGRPGGLTEPEISVLIEGWGLTRRPTYHTENPQTLANTVKAGLAVGLINALAMAVCETTGLAVRRVGRPDEGRTVGVWWDQERYLSAACTVVLDAIRDAEPPAVLVE